VSDVPDTDPPFYFRRVWTGATPADPVTVIRRRGHRVEILTDIPGNLLPEDVRREAQEIEDELGLPEVELAIYGRAIWPDDEHDRYQIGELRKRGQVFAECFSVRCPEGEVGTHPFATVTQITKDEFERARERGWE
jgi:hypothetical protein